MFSSAELLSAALLRCTGSPGNRAGRAACKQCTPGRTPGSQAAEGTQTGALRSPGVRLSGERPFRGVSLTSPVSGAPS